MDQPLYQTIPQAVAPRQSYGSKSPSRQNITRIAALIVCCGAAALVALSGVAVPQESHHASNVLAIKAQLQSQLQVEPELINAQQLPSKSTTDLAASARTFLDTAAGILQDAKSHAMAGDLSLQGIRLPGREMELSLMPSSATKKNAATNSMGKLLGTMVSTDESSKLEQLAGNTSTPAVMGATGGEVFGGNKSAVVGFLGFSKKEPTILGVPLPVCMFLFVITACATCITVGCLIARKTDILKVNVNEVGGAARPSDEEPDDEGYPWRTAEVRQLRRLRGPSVEIRMGHLQGKRVSNCCNHMRLS